jgi:predicted TIM-barrel fold metal-dependent hydrolase
MPGPRKSWLDLTTEPVVEPSLPICDPHHHLWNRADDRYLQEELLQDLSSGHNVVSTVFIECREQHRQDGPEELRPVGETEFVQRIADENARRPGGNPSIIGGIIGFANLGMGSQVAKVLEAHLAASPHRFRGIRHSCTWDASPAVKTATPGIPRWLMGESRFREGITFLKRYNLTFEAWLYHPQLPELAAMARAVPEVTMVLNHVGGLLGVGPYAGKRDEVFQVWKQGIAEVAACPNVVVKLGGLGMVRCGFEWHTRPAPPTSDDLIAATRPYYLYGIEQFGPTRCMFESNFPVDKLSCSYGVLWNSFKRMTQDFSTAERAAMFHDTAARVYRLAGV